MNLFIGDLPINATEGDLCRLLQLRQRDVARRLRIFKKAARDGHTRRFGLLHVAAGTDLRKLLDRGRGLELHGQRLNVREFVPRAVGNERRALDWRQRRWPHPERRQAERRAGIS